MNLPRLALALLVLLLAPACSHDGPQPGDDLVREKAARFFNLAPPELDHARQALKPLVERKQARLDDLIGGAAIELADGKLEATAAFVERAAKLDPNSAAVHFLRGQLANEHPDFKTARDEFQAALTAAPGDLPTMLALAQAKHELEDIPGAEALYRAVIDVGLENGQQWYVTAVYRMTRVLIIQDGREADLARYTARFQELSALGRKPCDALMCSLGDLARLWPPKSTATTVAKPACPPPLEKGALELTEFAGAMKLEALDLDDDLQPDLIATLATGARIALRREGAWKVSALEDTFLCAFDLDNKDEGPSWMTLCVLDPKGQLAFLGPDPASSSWSRRELKVPTLPSMPAQVLPVDFDHEGDIDLLLVGDFGARLWRNDGANTEGGAFVDATAESGLPQTGSFTWCLCEDLDGDNDVDLMLGNAKQLFVADSLRGGKFADVTRKLFPEGTGFTRAPLVADFDGDARPDLWSNDELWHQTPAHAFERQGPGGKPREPELARAADLDLDGALDVVTLSHDNFALVRLAIGTPVATTCTVAAGGLQNARGPFVVADLDGDGALEIAVASKEGLHRQPFPHGANRGLRVSLRGLRDNRRGLGSVVELKAGTVYRRAYWRGEPELLGVGAHETLDVLRTTWPNGASDTSLDQKQASFDHIAEPPALIGSCPFLYTWNGTRYEFVTDVLGITPLGLQMEPGMFVPPDHDEYVLVKGEQLAPKDGVLEMQFTEELREVTYLDHARLLAIDHAADTEIFPNERFTFPPFPEAHIHTVKGSIAPSSALGSDGRDWAKELARTDDVHAVPFTRQPSQFAGLAKPWFLDLTFDKEAVARAPKLRLVMTGWFFWSDASANMASARTPDVRFIPPIFQVPDGKGGWQDAGPPVGFPAGKTKTMVIDVTSILKRDDPRLRVFESLQMFWDSIRLAVDADDAPTEVRELPVASAKLWMRGFSAPLEHRDPTCFTDRPERFDWEHLAPLPRWNQHPGLYTRYGDVTPLTKAVDDQLVLLGAGDALTLRFDAKSLPATKPGMRRDYFVFLDGWAKDRDPNTVEALEVEPLPFHGMSGYPYRADEHFPDDEAHQRYRREWNTRPGFEWLEPISPVREAAWLRGGD